MKTKTRLTAQQQNVLACIRKQTLTRSGQLKRRIPCDCYDGRTINSLLARGLIEYGIGIAGTGYAATRL